MDTKRLEYFLDLVETENYSETAERMFTTQSNVSKQILALEKELDVRLFDRSHRKICLTEAGQSIVSPARQMLAAEQSLLRELKAVTHAGRQVIRIHAIPVIARYCFMEFLSGFRRRQPEITVQMAEIEKTDLERNLRDGRCDLIYTRLFAEESEDYDTIVTEKDHFVVVLPKFHAMAGQEVISLRELQAENFLLLNEKTSQLAQVLRLCREAAFEPQIAYTGVRIDTILGMVASGMGVSVLMEKSLPEDEKGELVKLPLAETAESVLAFAKLKGKRPSAAVKCFWTYLQEAVAARHEISAAEWKEKEP